MVAQLTAKEFVWVQHATGLIATLRCCGCFTAYVLRAALHAAMETQPARSHPLPSLPPTPSRCPCLLPRDPWPKPSAREHAPMSSANPPTGRRQVPVTNCNSRILFSLSISLITYNENVAGEWDPRHPQAHSPAGHGAPSGSTAPSMTTPCPPRHSPGRCSTLGMWSSPRLWSHTLGDNEQLCPALPSSRAIFDPFRSWPASSSTT